MYNMAASQAPQFPAGPFTTTLSSANVGRVSVHYSLTDVGSGKQILFILGVKLQTADIFSVVKSGFSTKKSSF